MCSGIFSIGIAKETPVYTVTCFGPTDIYLLLCNEGNLHSALKIWPHWLVLPLPQWFLRGERPQSTDASLYSASRLREDLFCTCTLAFVGAQAVKEALRSRVKSSWTWQGGSAFKGRCRILSYIILWDGPLKQNCVMGLALKSLACLTRLKGNDVKKKKGMSINQGCLCLLPSTCTRETGRGRVGLFSRQEAINACRGLPLKWQKTSSSQPEDNCKPHSRIAKLLVLFVY